jgi:hypothetical protein
MTSTGSTTMQQAAPGGSTNVSNIQTDQRLVRYWLAGGSGQPLGLARAETSLTTGDDDGLPEPGAGNEADYVIAKEVASLTFSYYGDNGQGLGWYSSWDGTDTSGSSSVPLGPPLAIAVEFQIPLPGSSPDSPQYQKFRHVIAIPTADGSPQTSSSSSSSSSSGSGSSGSSQP